MFKIFFITVWDETDVNKPIIRPVIPNLWGKEQVHGELPASNILYSQ